MASQDSSVPVTTADHEKGGHVATKSRFTWPIIVLRYLAFGATLSAFVVMITNKQTVNFFGAPGNKLSSKYYYSDAFLWFLIANGIGLGYTLLTAILSTFIHSPKLARSLLMLDLIVTYIILSGAAAATAVAYIGKHGIKEAFWPEICNTFERYCHHVLGALVASFLGWLSLTLVTIFSAHERFRRY